MAKLETDWRQERGEAVSRSSLALLALDIAEGEIGQREEGGNNAGPAVRLYRGDDVRGAWCASFVGYCFEQAALSRGIALPFKRSHGAKTIYRRIGRAGAFVDLPQPGDVPCWQRGNGTPADAWKGHVGIVSEVREVDGVVHFKSIEGNRGRYPAIVKTFAHTVGERRLIGFARLTA